jgi:hypothetical protein
MTAAAHPQSIATIRKRRGRSWKTNERLRRPCANNSSSSRIFPDVMVTLGIQILLISIILVYNCKIIMFSLEMTMSLVASD